MMNGHLAALVAAVACLGAVVIFVVPAGFLYALCAFRRLHAKYKYQQGIEHATSAKLSTAPGATQGGDNFVHKSTRHQRVTKDVTFVVTDVAGSTDLWEWNAEVMDLALQLHDATLRTLIFKHLGHEVTTEGDSFSVVFHDATDALQWCLQVQQALLEVNWPPLLLANKAAGEVWAMKPEGAYLDAAPEEQLVFRGLRVRMGAHTGNDCSISRHPVTGQLEYSGSTRALAEKVSDAGYGGQIMISETTSQHIYSRLPMLACNKVGGLISRQQTRLSQTRVATAARDPTLSPTSPQKSSAVFLSEQLDSAYSEAGTRGGSRTGEALSVHSLQTMSSASSGYSDVFDPVVEEAAHTFLVAPRLARQPKFEHRRLTGKSSEITRHGTAEDTSIAPVAADYSGPLLVDMGRIRIQVAGQTPEQVEIRMTLVVQSNLAGRLQRCPLHLTTLHIAPSYFDAPGAKHSVKYLGHMFPIWDRPHVTICFCAMPAPAASVRAGQAAADLRQYTDIVRCTLLACHGYECQEKEGVFMLAFQHTRHALEWGLTLQLALMEAEWGAQAAGRKSTEYDRRGNVVFKGVRARVGMFHGEVVKIVPHSRTGRADYFGLVLNRSARVQGAAHGGQVLAEGLAVDKAVQEWRAVYPQKKGKSSSKMCKYMPGYVIADSAEAGFGLESHCSLSEDLLSTIADFGAGENTFDAPPTDLLATSAGMTALLAQDRAMLQQASALIATRRPSDQPVSSSSSFGPPLGRISVQVDVHDLGLFSLKGINAPIHLTCVTPRMLSGRFDLYPQSTPSAKATRLKKGAGLLDTVTVELPDVRQIPFASRSDGFLQARKSMMPLTAPAALHEELLRGTTQAAGPEALQRPSGGHAPSRTTARRHPAVGNAASGLQSAEGSLLYAFTMSSSASSSCDLAMSPRQSYVSGSLPAVQERRHSSNSSEPELEPDHRAPFGRAATSPLDWDTKPQTSAKSVSFSVSSSQLQPRAELDDGSVARITRVQDGLRVQSAVRRLAPQATPAALVPASLASEEISAQMGAGECWRLQPSSGAAIASRRQATLRRSVDLLEGRTLGQAMVLDSSFI